MAITVKHKFVSTIPDSDDTSVVRPSNWNDDHDLTGTIPVANGGTGASTADGAVTNLLPSQTGNTGKYLTTDGTNTSWSANASGDVVGPSSATDNAIARFDTTTGKLIQNSVTTIDDTGNASGILSQQFSNGSAVTLAAGKMWYDGSTGAWNAGMGGGNITQQIGEELFVYGKASAAITDSPLQIVYHTGTVGASGVITFAPTIAGITDENAIMGVATENIANNGFGRVTAFGVVRGITTNGTAFGETWADDDVIWYNPVTGNPTKVKPVAPNIKFQIGNVIKAGAGGSGSFQVSLVQGTQLGGTDSNVQVTSPANGNLLTYDGGNGYWKNTNLTAGTGISVSKSANGVLTVTNSSPNTYDPAAVAITGGTINGTVIGGTTPAAGTFTTITGQTEVLRGTGTNFITYSEQFDNAAWTKTSSSVSANTSVAPNGTTTADTITFTGGGTLSRVTQNCGATSGVTYTQSWYVKLGTQNYVQLLWGGSSFSTAYYANFDISLGTVPFVGTGASAAITSAGSGWYRISLTSAATATSASDLNCQLCAIDSTAAGRAATLTASNTTIIAWGAQVEIASSVGTYLQTTTTAVYGTPTLSFSGVAGLGLQSDGSLYVSPAGTGALQAQATTSSTVGGNARGANAVDWQTSRTAATMVASGTYNAISGGRNNTASSFDSAIGGGSDNFINIDRSFIGGGNLNTVNGSFSSVVGGKSNTSGGYFNFIGGGFTNSGTASAAVTTQSGTMNATTAVTLSGSNASIKVGQYITGTSIAGDTYVAAISGTALTLSKAASGSSTSTLSFYTPHGVVVGGGNNQATGSYSFIGGGGDAGTAAQRNAATGDWSTVVGGRNNLASGLASFVGGGGTSGDNNTNGNQATAQGSMILGGLGNRATGQGSSVSAGWSNQANADFSSVLLGQYGTARSIQGNGIFSSNLANPFGFVLGSSQAGLLLIGAVTTDATATALRSNGGAASGTNQVILPNNSAYFFRGEVISGVTGGGDTKGWTIEGVIKRGANAASTALVGTPTVTSLYADAGAATWALAVTADTTNGGIRVTFTGQLATTIRTVCQIRTTEMTY
jgi:hypothetical protein